MVLTKKVLLIVEGAQAEKKLMRHFYSLYSISNIEIVSFETNIYVLHRHLQQFYSTNTGHIDYDAIDIVLVINEYLKLEENNKFNRTDFSDILLIFDFDPHDNLFDFKVVKELLLHFNNSTENGKLYINYPMVEAYKDIVNNFDHFQASKVQLTDIRRYKQLVGSRSVYTDLRKIDAETGNTIIQFHLNKLENITNKQLMDEDIYSALGELQNYTLQTEHAVFIINTCLIYFIEEYGELYI
ncbi:hypothetical protein [Paenibacillus montaniterrae]|nr:hypothetical protein [Paenibacillus montaniterrae]